MVWRLLGIAWYIPLCLVIGAILGYWLDGRFATDPLFTFIGLTLGLAIAILGTYRMVKPLMRLDEKTNEELKEE
ncbi:MAG: AtpZ/AtpI family protein [Chloroflexota bacterium]|nr:AtpZ/AtpI family protein [Chloroflexota bacterium]